MPGLPSPLHVSLRGGIHLFSFVFQCVGKLLFGCKISAIVIAGWGGRGRGGLVVDRLGLGGYVEGGSGYQTSPCAVWRESDPSTTTYHPGA